MVSEHKNWVYADESTPRYDIVVSLGTDHHQYNRAVEWIDAYLAKNTHLTCFFQHGFTTPPHNATETADILPRKEMLKIYERAGVAIVHGGPGCILDVRATGKVPLTMPRRPWLKEHVDEHQVKFTKVMDEYGEAHLVHDQQDLENKLDAVMSDPTIYDGSYRVSGADQASDELEAAINSIMPTKTIQPRRFIRRLGQVVGGIVEEKLKRR
ncbi:glycosyltransferase [uncultured Rothia sp.]|uniref:glycosyltransferase n=1 Tax=uncultured Rothia sp. TaxID=316088 RepID=UPI0032169BB4